MSRISYDQIIKYDIEACTLAPMHIGGYLGGTDEVLMDPKDGKPFIQASTLAGLFRSACEKKSPMLTTVLFGDSRSDGDGSAEDVQSRIKVTDGKIKADSLKMEIRPNVKIDPQTGTTEGANGSGQKFETTYVSAGAEFCFSMLLYVEKSDTTQMKHFEELLGIMKTEENGLCSARIGSKKSSGAGIFKADKVTRYIFDMTKEEDREAWIENADPAEVKVLDDNDISPISMDSKYEIIVKAKTKGPIQVKGIAVNGFGSDVPDSENMTDGRGRYIIPGTSVRGSVRSQMEKIADYMKVKAVIENSFGKIGETHDEGRAGNLIFQDAVFCEEDQRRIAEKTPIRHRIHIDKFTGGVFSRGLFSEKNASGDVTLQIQILNKYDADASLGLLLLALRDLAGNLYNLGNGYATGKGFLEVSEILVKFGNTEAKITYGKDEKGHEKSEITDAGALFTTALNALNGLKEA